MEYDIIQFSCLCLLNDLPRFVESLQGKQAVGEIRVVDDIIRARRRLSRYASAAFSYCPCAVYTLPRPDVRGEVSRVALNPLLIGLCSFLQFPGYVLDSSRP